MGHGSVERRDYHTTRGYFKIKDYDAKYGGTFWFLIEPLIGWSDDERFFYVKELENGMYEVTGEGHVIYKASHLTAELARLRIELAGILIYYLFIDQAGNVVRKEQQNKKERRTPHERSSGVQAQ